MRVLLTSAPRQDCRIGCSACVSWSGIRKKLTWRLRTDPEHLGCRSRASKQCLSSSRTDLITIEILDNEQDWILVKIEQNPCA
jgi:hypothetical protein